MRVLVLTRVYPNAMRPTLGMFVRERTRHVAAGADVVVVAPVSWFPFNRWLRGRVHADAPRTEERDGLTVHHPRIFSIPGVGKCLDPAFYALSLLPFLVRLRGRFRFDLIDAHFGYPDGVAAAILGRVFRCPVVVTLRGTTVDHAKHRLRRGQIVRALRSAARVVAVSDFLRRFAAGLGVSPERLRVIPNAIDAEHFRPEPRDVARRRLGLPEDRLILLTVGGLVEGKGQQRMLEVLPRLIERRPDVLYAMVGDPAVGAADSIRNALQATLRERGLESHARIVGARPHDEIQHWMAAADLFVLPTRREGWCNALMEALACGLPVVTTDVGGNAEIVRDGIDGFLVPFWDPQAFLAAVVAALDRPWKREENAARIRATTWQATADRVLDEFRACCAPS